MKYKIPILVILFLFANLSYAQVELALINVKSGDFSRANSLIRTDLEGLNLDLANGRLVLFNNETNQEVESQLDMDNGPKLYWVLDKVLEADAERRYVLKQLPYLKEKNDPSMKVIQEKGNLIIKSEGKPVLQYNLVEAPLPEGADKLYSRAAYIHPLWSPSGEVLTRINPSDHYHHYGIWNPWTHTEYQGDVIDFWNLIKADGTVRPSTVISKTSNNLFGGFKVIQDHVYLQGRTKTSDEIVLKEELNIRAWKLNTGGWVIDFTSTYNNPTDSILTILKYRYQGIGFRGTEKWNDKTASILTSEGKDKSTGNSTRSRWCDVNGVSSAGTSGILFITNPSNFNYPEPIRIWPTGSNEGKENVFFNFNPTMDRDWNIQPGVDYQLKYRMFVYDGKIEIEQAESLWRDFAFPPIAEVEYIRK